MPIDKYQPCPCGSGKKIKFCCSADIAGELDKIQRMLDGDQLRACLEHVNHLQGKYPDRPSLLSIKAMLEAELGDTEHAEETVKALLETTPDNPIAFAEQARLFAQEGKALEAVDALQNALDATDASLATRVYSALGEVAAAVLKNGSILAARAHLLLHASLGGEDDPRSAELLMRINGSVQIPSILRQDTPFVSCANDAPYVDAFVAAMSLVGHARWRAALKQLEELAQKHGREVCIHRNIAILRSFLGHDTDASRAWRKYAGLIEAESLDDAVEAEALAQLLDGNDVAESIDLLDVTYEINDLDRLMEVLLADRRTPTLPVDLASLAEDGSPAPKAVFSLLNRDMPETGKDLTIDAAPNAWCDFYVYGRETDKPPRLKLVTNARCQADVHAAVTQVCGDWIAAEPQVEGIGKTDVMEEAMTWSWRLPDDTPREIRQKLHNEKQRSVIFDVWQTIPQTALDGKAPQEVQGDLKYRIRLLAAILLLEQHGQQNRWQLDYDELRSKLDLPTAEPIVPEQDDLRRIPLIRYGRLDASKLSTAKLASSFQYAMLMQNPAAIQNLGEELIERDEQDMDISRADVYGILARVAADNSEALALIEKARDCAVADSKSPAQWLLAELSLQIEQGNGERVQELIQRIQAKHQREPGVMESLFKILASFGLIDPYAASGMGEAMSAGAAPVAETASEGGIWTPGQASGPAKAPQAADGGQAKSGLILPDMD